MRSWDDGLRVTITFISDAPQCSRNDALLLLFLLLKHNWLGYYPSLLHRNERSHDEPLYLFQRDTGYRRLNPALHNLWREGHTHKAFLQRLFLRMYQSHLKDAKGSRDLETMLLVLDDIESHPHSWYFDCWLESGKDRIHCLTLQQLKCELTINEFCQMVH